MNHLTIALGAPGISERPRALLLWGTNETTYHWLAARGVEVETIVGSQNLSKVLDSEDRWDLIIVTVSVQRFYDTSSRVEIERFSQWLRSHSVVTLLTPRKHYVDPTRNGIGPWRLDPEFFEFTFTTEVKSDVTGEPMAILSDHGLWNGERWLARDAFHSGRLSRAEQVNGGGSILRRQHFAKDGSIFKVEVGSPEYFDSIEILREAAAIQNLSADMREIAGLPNVISVQRGSAISVLHRDAIEGTPLLDVVQSEGVSPGALARHVFLAAVSYARVGLFHNDFRPWNIVVTGTSATLVDYADVSCHDLDSRSLPQIVALFGTLVAVGPWDTTDEPIRMFEHFDTDTLNLAEPLLRRLNVSLESLYYEPWLELPFKINAMDQLEEYSLDELARILFTPITPGNR